MPILFNSSSLFLRSIHSTAVHIVYENGAQKELFLLGGIYTYALMCLNPKASIPRHLSEQADSRSKIVRVIV